MQCPTDRSRRTCLLQLVTVFAILACIAGFIFANIYPFIRHGRVRDRMETAILKLAVARPPDLTDDQWAYCIFWTWNLQGNYGSVPSYVPTADLERIAAGLERRIERGVSVQTIDWVWDQYIQAFPDAASYNHHRPTAPRNRARFEAGDHGGNPLSVWRADYERRVGPEG